MKTTLRKPRSVFERRAARWFLQVQWNGLDATAFYVRARSRKHAEELFEALLQCPDVAGISMFVNGKFVGARDGAGS